MQWCRDHAKNIQQERATLGLLGARLRLEFKGIDVNDPLLDGYFCPICIYKADYAMKKDTDGRFSLSVWTGKKEPHLIID
jgi:hypothetical protein